MISVVFFMEDIINVFTLFYFFTLVKPVPDFYKIDDICALDTISLWVNFSVILSKAKSNLRIA